MYNLSSEKPPVYDMCVEQFGISWTNTIFAYGDTIHAEYPERLSKDIIEHEKIHLKQQGGNPESWWERYFVDSEFRLSQELEAYQRQYRVLREYEDKNELVRKVYFWADMLSGKQYGYLISKEEAIKKIIYG